jgi:lipid II:glycine glycyltransferase (peptidoglycan interpeptide bridge formation enzyme)
MLKAVAQHFGQDCTTWVAFSEGVPVAAIIVLRAGSRVYGWRAAMDKALGGPKGASQLLQKLVIEDACANGCQSYDMGIAVPGTSLADFKERFGATLSYTHYLQAQRVPVQQAIDAPKNLAKKTATALRIG